MVDFERPLDTACLYKDASLCSGAIGTGRIFEYENLFVEVLILYKSGILGIGQVVPHALCLSFLLRLGQFFTFFIDKLIAPFPVGTHGKGFVALTPTKIELILGDGEVVLSVVDDLVNVAIVPNEYVPIDVDRLSGKRLLGRVCTRTFYIGDVEAVAVVTQDV